MEMRNVMLNKDGFTLIEVMISLVVMLVIFMGLMRGAVVTIHANTLAALREEAVSVAQMDINEVRSIPFDTLLAGTTTDTVLRNFRNMDANTNGGFPFIMSRTVSDIDTNNKMVTITVTWDYKPEWNPNPNDIYTYTTTNYVVNTN